MEYDGPKFVKQNYINDVYFINDENEKVYVHCDYKIIINELTKLGIYNSNSTIEEIMDKFNLLLVEKHAALVRDRTYLRQLRSYNKFHNKIRVLYLSMLEVRFYLYDYNAAKMPTELKRLFTCKYR
jgi:hypothetical protein